MGSQRVGHDSATFTFIYMASRPITSWQIDGETMGTVTDFIFLGSKITAGGDCSHEIKRHLLLERKAMTNLGNPLKSRDVTLLAKGSLVKVTVFLVVVYGCESYTIKKAECWRNNAFELWCWRRLLRIPWTARRSNQPILKEINPEYSLEGVMLKLKLHYFLTCSAKSRLIWKDPDAVKEWRQEEKGTTEDEMVGWHHHPSDSRDTCLSKFREAVKDQEAWSAAVREVAESRTQLNSSN